MPEGDSIHRVARLLAQDLPGRTIDRLALHDRGDVDELAGRVCTSVTARGKHLLIAFDNGWTLRVHLGMNGKWLRRHARERRARTPTVLIVVGDVAYVCVRAYQAELVRDAALRSNPRLARLGPDLLAEPAPIDDAVARARMPAHANREVADVLLDQRVAAGIGNIYRSEVLFECRVNPHTRMHALTDDQVRSLYETAARLLRLNLLTRRRTTVPLRRRNTPTTQRFWVYGRAGKPCLDCGAKIEWARLGDMARSAYWCPNCQS